MKRSYRHKDPKLRYLTICKIERLERKIEGLIAADHAMYDAGFHRVSRGSARAAEDGRAVRFKLRQAEKAAASPPAPAPGTYPSDQPTVPANWRNQPVGGSFRCIWGLDRCRAYFNPAAWSLAEEVDGYTLVRRIGPDAHAPASPDDAPAADPLASPAGQ